MVVAGLSTGHEIGLAVVAAIFIGFALTSSFLAPRRWPDFPGRAGLPVFVIASFVLFAGMLSAVELFGAESEAHAAQAVQSAAPLRGTFQVKEKEFKILLPAAARKTLTPGRYVFVSRNVGAVGHNLAIQGPRIPGGKQVTPLIQPGQSAKLTVTLVAGAYTLYCAVPGHREAGMVAKILVG